MIEAQKALGRLAFNFGLDALDDHSNKKVRQDMLTIQDLLNCQLSEQEIRETILCISMEITRLALHYDFERQTVKQQVLYSARDKLLKQIDLIGGNQNGKQ